MNNATFTLSNLSIRESVTRWSVCLSSRSYLMVMVERRWNHHYYFCDHRCHLHYRVLVRALWEDNSAWMMSDCMHMEK